MLLLLPKQKSHPRSAGSSKKGGKLMYTDYGYIVDGIEYATADEANAPE